MTNNQELVFSGKKLVNVYIFGAGWKGGGGDFFEYEQSERVKNNRDIFTLWDIFGTLGQSLQTRDYFSETHASQNVTTGNLIITF